MTIGSRHCPTGPEGNRIPFRISLEGIDGSGKTTVASGLSRVLTPFGPTIVLQWLHPDKMPDAPLRDLSQHLAKLAARADRSSNHRLKLAVWYLQGCMYSPLEHFAATAYAPQIMIADRHPLVAAPVYLPLYRRAIHRSPDNTLTVHDHLMQFDPDAARVAIAWGNAQSRRLDADLTLDDLASLMLELAELPQQHMQLALATHWQANLPDAIVFLDIDVEEAFRRAGQRHGDREPHESLKDLEKLRRHYIEFLERSPDVGIYHIDANRKSTETIIQEILDCLPKRSRSHV